MAKTIGELIHKLATKAGIDPTNEQLMSVLTKAELANAPIPESLSTSILSYTDKLLTEDSAKNNDTLKNHYFALYAKGNEAKMKALLDENGLSDLYEDIVSEKGQGTKIEKLVNAIKDAESKKASAKGGDKKEYEQMITDLNNQLKTVKDSIPSIASERDNYWKTRVQNTEMNRMLSTYQYGIDLPSEVILQTANALVSRKLQEQKLKVDFNPDTNNFSLKTESDMEYFKDNTPVPFKSFVDSVLAENKMLKIAGSASATGGSTKPAQFERQQPAKGQIDFSNYDAVINEQIERANKLNA